MHHFRAWHPPHRCCPHVTPHAGGLGQPSPALTLADAAPALYIAPRICRKHLQGQGTTPALPCSSKSSHGLMEEMASDGNGLSKAVGNQRPPEAHLKPKGELHPSPESPRPPHLPGSCATPLHGRAGPSVMAGSAVFSGFTAIVVNAAFLPNSSLPLLKVQSRNDPLQGAALQAMAHPPG